MAALLPLAGQPLEKSEASALKLAFIKVFESSFDPTVSMSAPLSCRMTSPITLSAIELEWFQGEREVLVLLENYDAVIVASVDVFLRFWENREPWQCYDICLFERSMRWCICLTHNNNCKYIVASQP